MAEGKEIIETHGGFVISVLATAKSSPHPPGYIAFGYVAMLHRPDTDIRMADQKVDFSRPVADIPWVKMPGRQVLMTGDRSLTAHIPVGSLGAVYI